MLNFFAITYKQKPGFNETAKFLKTFYKVMTHIPGVKQSDRPRCKSQDLLRVQAAYELHNNNNKNKFEEIMSSGATEQ